MNKQLLAIIAGAVAFSASGFTIVQNGKPAATIHVNAPVSDKEIPITEGGIQKLSSEELDKQILNTAVKDLNYHIKKMSGTELPVKYRTSANAPGIFLELKEGEQDAFTINSEKGRITISGKNGAAIANGIYEMLYRLGCDWVFPGPVGEVIPKKATIEVPVGTITGKPDFAVRCPWYPGNVKKHSEYELRGFTMWKLRNKMQLHRYNHPLVMIGGHVSDALIRKYKN